MERRLAVLTEVASEMPPEETVDLLAEVRRRLDEGLTIEQRQEIVRLLASIVVQTERQADDKRQATALVTYRFPGVVETGTGIRASRNYTVRRVIELGPSRYRTKVAAS